MVPHCTQRKSHVLPTVYTALCSHSVCLLLSLAPTTPAAHTQPACPCLRTLSRKGDTSKEAWGKRTRMAASRGLSLSPSHGTPGHWVLPKPQELACIVSFKHRVGKEAPTCVSKRADAGLLHTLRQPPPTDRRSAGTCRRDR